MFLTNCIWGSTLKSVLMLIITYDFRHVRRIMRLVDPLSINPWIWMKAKPWRYLRCRSPCNKFWPVWEIWPFSNQSISLSVLFLSLFLPLSLVDWRIMEDPFPITLQFSPIFSNPIVVVFYGIMYFSRKLESRSVGEMHLQQSFDLYETHRLESVVMLYFLTIRSHNGICLAVPFIFLTRTFLQFFHFFVEENQII